MIGSDLNLGKMMPLSRDIGSRSKSTDALSAKSAAKTQDPFLIKQDDPMLAKNSDPMLARRSDPMLAQNTDPMLKKSSDPMTVAAKAPNTQMKSMSTRSTSAKPASDSESVNDAFSNSIDNSLNPAKKISDPSPVELDSPIGSDDLGANNELKTEPRATMQTIAKVQTATRQAAMQVFLERMQNELGIEPEKIVQAFSQLTNDDLMASPEDSSAKFISQLQLSPKDSKKALGLYNEMLSMVAATGLAQTMANTNQQANISVTDKEQEEIKTLRTSINDMSDRFFMTGNYHMRQSQNGNAAAVTSIYGKNALNPNGPIQNGAAQAQDGADALSNLSAEQRKTLGLEQVNSQGQIISQEGGPQVVSAMSAGQMAALANQASTANTAAVASAASGAETEAPAVSESFLKKIAGDAYGKATSAAGNQTTAAVAPNVADKAAATTTATAAATAGAVTAMSQKGNSHSGTGADSDKNDKETDEVPLGQMQNLDQNKAHQAGKPFNLDAAKSATPADMQANIKELISQAQLLTKKGGGEMKISLNPEGLGEVHLKVAMQNGQVNVSMVASNDEAKKALEKGLTELKANLATHKLNLESVNIGSSKDISQQMQQQRQDLERGYQQRFLSDFQERNGSNRREMFEFPGPTVPSNQRNDPAQNSLYATSKRKDARRLDLVA